jgi:hypothetical protein
VVNNKSNDVEVSHAVPLVKHAATLSTEFLQAPLFITPDVQLCLAYYDAFVANAFAGVNGYKGLVKVQVDPARDRDALNKQVENMFKVVLAAKDIKVPPLKSYWNMFFKMLAERCQWLHYYCEHILFHPFLKIYLLCFTFLIPQIYYKAPRRNCAWRMASRAGIPSRPPVQALFRRIWALV